MEPRTLNFQSEWNADNVDFGELYHVYQAHIPEFEFFAGRVQGKTLLRCHGIVG